MILLPLKSKLMKTSSLQIKLAPKILKILNKTLSRQAKSTQR